MTATATIGLLMDLDTRSFFRLIAFAEAASWAALLISMYIKYGPADNPVGVQIFGMVHGILFIVYLLTTVVARARFQWSAKVFILAGLSAIPPFCTAIFEIVADRRGLLQAPATSVNRPSEPAAPRS